MKKRIGLKIISILLAVTTLLPVLALTACTDKSKPIELNNAERTILGKWENWNGIFYTFKSDRTYELSNGNKGEFRYICDGVDARGNHFEQFEFDGYDGWYNILFDDDIRHIYRLQNGMINYEKAEFTRV